MAYDTRYDPSTDFTMNGVVAHSQPYLKGGTAFTASTSPTLTQVEGMVNRRVFQVMAHLARNGYALAPTDTDVLTILATACIYGTLMEIELGKANAVQQRGEQARWQLYERRWNEAIALCEGATLEYLGATRTRDLSSGLEFTGQTWSEQDTVAEDEDLKGAAFPRGWLDPVGRQQPATDDDAVVPA